MISFKKLGNFGRLGNSIFEAAATIALAKRNDDQYIFPPWADAQYFNLNNCFSNSIQTTSNYEETCYAYRPIPYKPNLNIHGYFQSEKYFIDYADEIRRIFTPKSKIPRHNGVASIHVRRTDYIKFPNHHPLCDMSYYEKAMMEVGVNKFIIFSDDMAWCKEHFKGNQFEFSEGNAHYQDLALMASCEHHIIANSSFSWWGAWLNPNKKNVIAPKRWFGPALAPTHPITDLIPNGWRLI